MRTFTKLAAAFAVFVTLAACNETGLSSVVLTDTGPAPVEDDPIVDEPVDDPVDDTDDPDPIAEPIADAGPDQTIPTGNLQNLDGTQSYDPAGLDPLDFEWSLVGRPAGSVAKLSAVDVAVPNFIADLDGTYVFELTVQNAGGVWDSTPDVVTINAEVDPVIEPVANAGPDQVVNEGNLVVVNGTASFDPTGLSPLSYQWNMSAKPIGSSAALSSPTSATPNFTADIPGDYVVQLTVQNTAGIWDSTPDSAVITADEVVIGPPVADAGADQSVDEGDLVFLSGSASYDPGGYAPLQYRWSVISKPAGSVAFLLTSGSVATTFVADRSGSYTLELGVMNTAGLWDPTPDRVTINAAAPPVTEPVAQAGPDQAVAPLDTVFLNGNSSYDPGGLPIVGYQWTLIGRPSGSTTVLSSTTSSTPNFFADLAGDYVFDLTVQNSAGLWDSTPDQVKVTATPADGFYVEVSWDVDSDLDLHVLNGSTGLFGSGDCSWCNMTPNWGGGGSSDDPSLDWDAILGWGPETTTIDAPAGGTYQVKVHYYGQGGASSCDWGICPASTATAKIFLGGSLAATYTKTIYDQGDVWNVATIAWPSGLITPQNSISYTSETYCW